VSESAPRRYWWVNQNKTFRQEVGGGYLWAPKTTKNNRHIPAYDNMREVRPGDIIFSSYRATIAAVGVALSSGYDCVVPEEFAKQGERWNSNGWRVDARYTRLQGGLEPRRHMDLLRPLLPARLSPLQDTGRGVMQYLFELPETFAQVLLGLLETTDREAISALRGELVAGIPEAIPSAAPVKEWEDHIQKEILANPSLEKTEKRALVTARIGQGKFKENVWEVERTGCRVTGVTNPNHLIGSHIKPWRHSSNTERLAGENGLLLTPSIDHLFDHGHISFKNSGELLISPRADRESLAKMGIKDESSVILRPFTHRQREHLDFHRDSIFLRRKK
jgi:putative restriction endonuclease